MVIRSAAQRHDFRRGFSFLEIAIVLAVTGMIAGIVLTSVMSSTTQNNAQCTASTKQQLNYIRAQVETFARQQNRLPMPAARNIGSDSPAYGREASGSDIDEPGSNLTVKVSIGALPFKALGLGQEYAGDCWGNKFTYMVTTQLATLNGYQDSNIDGNITLKSSLANVTNNKIAYTIISHGMDGLGAVKLDYSAANKGTGTPDPAHKWCTGAVTLANTNCLATYPTVMDAPFNNGADAGASYFDDLVMASERPAILSSVVPVHSWGNNFTGQRGNGTVRNFWAPTANAPSLPAGVTRFTAISGARFFGASCAIANTGRAYCWGASSKGKIGDGIDYGDAGVPLPTGVKMPSDPGVTHFTSISTGGQHNCAIANTGRAYCWGWNFLGPLGDGTAVDARYVPTAVRMPTDPGVTGFTSISAGLYHTCAIANTGRAYCWGWDAHGQIGINAALAEVHRIPKRVPLPTDSRDPGVTGFTNINAGYYNTCAIANTGRAYCWGWNQYGQLGDGSRIKAGPNFPWLVDKPSGVNRFTSITGGEQFTCGLSDTGQPYCWGSNRYGELGVNSKDPTYDNSVNWRPRAVLLPVGVSRFTDIITGQNHACGIGDNGRAYCWGRAGQIGDGTTAERLLPTAVTMPDGVASVASITTSFMIGNNGSAYGWGYPSWLGFDFSSVPTNYVTLPTGVTEFTSVSAGLQHQCAIGNNGRIYCWGGDNMRGEMGNNTYLVPHHSPTSVVMPTDPGVTGFKSVAAGTQHNCAIANNNHAYCWGESGTGALGNGSQGGLQLVPKAVTLPFSVTGFKSISVGGYHSCGIGIMSNRTVALCWGSNTVGQVGTGAVSGDWLIPTPVSTTVEFTAISAGVNHNCGLDTSGRIYCWGGNNTYGEMGIGTTGTRQLAPTVPVAFPSGVTSFTDVSAGAFYTCAVANTGALYCWGSNTVGQLGDGTEGNARSTPVAVTPPAPGIKFTKVVTKKDTPYYSTCAVTDTGSIYCWGYNQVGQLGDNSMKRRLTPAAVTMPGNGYKFSNVSIGYDHAFAW